MHGFARTPGTRDDCDDVQRELNLVSLALDAAGDSIIIHRTDGQLVRFNEEAAAQLGMTFEQFSQLEPWGWAQPLPHDARQERLTQLRELGEVSFVAHRTVDGNRRMLHEVRCRWIEAPGGPYVVAISRDVTEQISTRELLENLAFHDALTGLANRALFDDRLEIAMASARRHDDLLCVAFLDLDDFKSINDEHGHLIGDAVLAAIAGRLERSVREEDTVGRFGGDEFAVLFPRVASVDDVEKLAFDLADAVAQNFSLGALELNVTASVGLAVFQPDDDAGSLLNRADSEMYRARRSSETSRPAALRQRD